MSIGKFILKNAAARAAGPKMPPYWIFREDAVAAPQGEGEYSGLELLPASEMEDIARSNALGVPMRLPVELRVAGGEWWLLPFEPLVSLTGRNTIVRRQVMKGARGSIKERWSQDDYSVSLQGIFLNTQDGGYPRDDVRRLRALCEAAAPAVRCPMFELFGINRIAVENYEFPFTTGQRNQAWRIAACSDNAYKLLIKMNELRR